MKPASLFIGALLITVVKCQNFLYNDESDSYNQNAPVYTEQQTGYRYSPPSDLQQYYSPTLPDTHREFTAHEYLPQQTAAPTEPPRLQPQPVTPRRRNQRQRNLQNGNRAFGLQVPTSGPRLVPVRYVEVPVGQVPEGVHVPRDSLLAIFNSGEPQKIVLTEYGPEGSISQPPVRPPVKDYTVPTSQEEPDKQSAQYLNQVLPSQHFQKEQPEQLQRQHVQPAPQPSPRRRQYDQRPAPQPESPQRQYVKPPAPPRRQYTQHSVAQPAPPQRQYVHPPAPPRRQYVQPSDAVQPEPPQRLYVQPPAAQPTPPQRQYVQPPSAAQPEPSQRQYVQPPAAQSTPPRRQYIQPLATQPKPPQQQYVQSSAAQPTPPRRQYVQPPAVQSEPLRRRYVQPSDEEPLRRQYTQPPAPHQRSPPRQRYVQAPARHLEPPQRNYAQTSAPQQKPPRRPREPPVVQEAQTHQQFDHPPSRPATESQQRRNRLVNRRRHQSVETPSPQYEEYDPAQHDFSRDVRRTSASHSRHASARRTPAQSPQKEREQRPSNFRPANLEVRSLPEDTDGDGIPGEAGMDYPTLHVIPSTSFACTDQDHNGYYADLETACQVVHLCQAGGVQNSFLCPNGTIFNQEKFSCQWWFKVKCESAPNFYGLNDNLYKVPGPKEEIDDLDK